MTIVYHGLGYVGLTGAVHFAQAAVDVLGYDPSIDIVEAINHGKPRAGDFLSYLGNVAYRDRFKATAVFSDTLKTASNLNGLHSVHILAVPSERNGEPWMDLVLRIVEQLCDELPIANAGTKHLIIVESTCTPGTLDRARTERDDVLLAVAPRRDWFADPKKNLSTIKRVVGGKGAEATLAAIRVLQHVTPIENIIVTDHKTAELVKPLENALFHLPIMLGHELALAFPNHNVAEALQYAVTHWRFESFGGLYIGAGSGGRCVPLGAKYLNASSPCSLLNTALHVDKQMPFCVADAIVEAARRLHGTPTGSRSVLILGVAYRPGFRDAGLSPGLRVAKELKTLSYDVRVVDPYFTDDELSTMGVTAGNIEDINEYDVVVVTTGHKEFLELPNWQNWKPNRQVIVDPQGIWKTYREQFASNACEYIQVGVAGWRG